MWYWVRGVGRRLALIGRYDRLSTLIVLQCIASGVRDMKTHWLRRRWGAVYMTWKGQDSYYVSKYSEQVDYQDTYRKGITKALLTSVQSDEHV